eukprot:gene11211-3266_t
MPYRNKGPRSSANEGQHPKMPQYQGASHPSPPQSPAGGTRPSTQLSEDELILLIQDLQDANKRENAMATLSKHRDSVKKLAVMLWHSFGIVPILLDEVVSIYPYLCPEQALAAAASNRVCNALALLQCTASSADTRSLFLYAYIPLYLYPLLATTTRSRSFEYLRLTSLGVIGALVKTDDQDVVKFLLQTEMIPLCLNIMERGTELSRTVATFIVQKILFAEVGLAYICQTFERFSHVALILGKMVHQLAKNPSARLMKHIIRCYYRLSDNSRAREAMASCLPDPLKDGSIENSLAQQNDTQTLGFLRSLLENIAKTPPPQKPPTFS